eukprot:TRINITY_DN2156_c0_g1_i3.p2 TRINITY_DN2156_c0_g1~~TRINITY_DN2156_c0_g1_i3.p2  ORF type:complete len:218 (+),score=14.94 TRINITY_DN2156_c0_g1_i3:273-926(+)
MMNSFRLLGDMMHLMSILVLLLKIYSTRSCRGISLKTQELYLIVFVSRYLDLFVYYVSLYNTTMKLVFVASSAFIIYLMRFHKVIKTTYDKENDTFQYLFLIGPSAVLALLINAKFTALEILWTFSIYLESVAILPQLWQLQRTSNIDNLTGNYVFLLGCYRALYILNWIYRYFTESHYSQWIVWISGLVQTGLYCDFFYYYLKSWKENKALEGLPK